ncbi:LppM family (lipo)protein [Demequina capsici]|uniref:LppM domain-containing protein n=1 Tax=Demequina capsici TaxID=3075620 RepID=A0AA96F8K2_9MICO|nr:hypothetical protein [Demequina sp. OYTSA14]WNM24640.1 hypothetical protein RN606_00380 [Demequina sp. OYTSA14]
MLRRTRTRLGALALVLLSAAALSGCYTMKSTTVFHADDTVDVTASMAFDESVLTQLGQTQDSIVQQFQDSLAAQPDLAGKVTVAPYDADGQTGFSVTATGLTPAEATSLLSSNIDVSSDGSSADGSSSTDPGTAATQLYSHSGGTITVSSTPSTPSTDATPAGAQSSDATVTISGDASVDPTALGIVIEERYTFPGPVQSTTIGHVDPDDPNTVVVDDYSQAQGLTAWQIVAADAAPGFSFGNVGLLALCGLLVVGAIGAFGYALTQIMGARRP